MRKRKTVDEKRHAATERQRKSRRERELRDQGYEKAELWLPPAIRSAWEIRERSSDPNAPLR